MNEEVPYTDESILREGGTLVRDENTTILAQDCYGSTIYKTSGGPITLPAGVKGMLVYIICTATLTSNLGVQSGEYLDDVLNGTDDIKAGGSHPLLHTLICGANGKWYLSHP